MNLKGLADLVKEHFKLSSLPNVAAPEITEVLPKSYEEMGEIIYLDLDNVVLYTGQTFVNGYVVDSIVRGIGAGDTFPPVFVSENSDGSYYLEVKLDPLDSKNYGGNHRAIAHKKAKTLLKCVKVNDYRNVTEQTIDDVAIVEGDYQKKEYLAIKSKDKRYK